MLLHEKIRQTRKEKNLTQLGLIQRLRKIFGDKVISKRTLERIENGHTTGHTASIWQICVGLGIKVDDQWGDNQQDRTSEVTYWDTKKRSYLYNSGASAAVLSQKELGYFAAKLYLAAKGATKSEAGSDGNQSCKWIYVLKGSVILHIEQQKYIVKTHQCVSFASAKPHYIENPNRKKAVCLIIKNPW